MNEASSKFVDNLALDKLLNKKLKKVSHSPEHSFFAPGECLFNSIEKTLRIGEVKCTYADDKLQHFEIPSFEKSIHYSENNTIHLYYHPTEKAEFNLLLVHGLFDDNMLNYEFIIKLLNDLNFNVYFMTLPYHFQRKPETSMFSGEFFFSADISRTQSALKQSLYDIEASFQFIKSESSLTTALVGFSMGGCIALRYQILKNQELGVFLINPLTDLSMVLGDNPLLATVRADIERCGYSYSMYKDAFSEFDPCRNLGPNFNDDKIAVVHSSFDQIITKQEYLKFFERTGIRKCFEYNSGHLNVFRVPRLSVDIYNFVKNLYC